MECHKCQYYMKNVGTNWEETPCSRCQLNEDSYGTLPYWENFTENILQDDTLDDESWIKELPDTQIPQPYEFMDGDDTDDPRLPLSAFVSALSLWINLPLPTRKNIQMRMKNLPYSAIAKRLGISRQAVEKCIAQAIAREPLLQNLLPRKEPRDANPLSATHETAVADINRRSSCRRRKSRK